MVFARSGRIEPEDLLLDASEPVRAVPDPEPASLQEALDAATIGAIRAALEETEGRRAEAAEILGVDRTTLYRLMKRHAL